MYSFWISSSVKVDDMNTDALLLTNCMRWVTASGTAHGHSVSSAVPSP